jgi:hypothetical protein
MIAGAFVLGTIALGDYVDPRWFLLTAFVGLNLFQSAFTNWCPMMTFLRKVGVPDSAACALPAKTPAGKRSVPAG